MKILRNLAVTLIVFAILALPMISFAQTTIINPIPKINDINDFIKTILEAVIKIGMPIIAIAIVYCGFLFVEAQGKPDKLKTAKDAFVYTLIGAALLLGSWAIAQMISDTVLAL